MHIKYFCFCFSSEKSKILVILCMSLCLIEVTLSLEVSSSINNQVIFNSLFIYHLNRMLLFM